jgi:hypothetical protein
MAISRREALKLSGMAVAATAVAGCSNLNTPNPEKISKKLIIKQQLLIIKILELLL